jgi:carboxypeptidase D
MAWGAGALLVLLSLCVPDALGAEAIRKQIRDGRLQSVRIEYALPDPVLETLETADGQRFTDVKVADSGRSADIGRPDLPTLVDDIAVARRGEIGVRLAVRGQRRLSTPHWVYPVQESLPKLPGARERRRFRMDDAWYRTAGRSGASGTTVPFTTTTYTVRGERFVRVQALPYAYDPLSKVLTYPATVSVEVSVADPVLPAAAGPRLGPLQILRVPLTSGATLADLQARGLDIATVRAGEAIIYATLAEREALEQAGYSIELLDVQTGDPAAAAVKGITAGYHDWGQLQAMMSQFASTYPTLCRLETIGSSGDGRPILALRITDNPGSEEAEPEVRFVGAIHGDENVGSEMSLLFIDYLLAGYAGNSRIKALVDSTDIWIVPVMNPDGFVADRRYSSGGIDLNRSFPDGAESAIGTVFGGPAMDTAGRPAETVAMMQWSAAHHFVLSAVFHSGALLANYPYDNDGLGSVPSPTPDEDVFTWLAETYSSRNAPMWASTSFTHGITNGADWYVVVGGMQDWLYRYTGCMDLTLEISDSFQPAASALPGLWNDNREAMLAYLEGSHVGLCGVVTEAAKGQPVYASIAIQGRAPQVYSDPALGDYYRLLRPGTYTVVVAAPGYQPQVLPDIIVGAGAATRLDVVLQETGSTGGTPLLAVHHADHDLAFAAYRDQKQTEGYAVTEVRLTGTPSAESVRTQIRAAYAATAARYVVLLGDVEKVPTFTNSVYGTTARSDLPYALLDPGETFDSFLGKDVGLGRISLDSNAELLEYVAKLGAFVRGPRHHDLTWVSGGAATWENDLAEGTHDYVIANYVDAKRFHHQKFYRGGGSAPELSDHIAAGTDAVMYSGHGYETGWLRYDYEVTDLAGLLNTLDAPIVIGHCCLTGSFQLDDCFAEQWLATKERAVAYVGGSQNTLWSEDDTLQRREFQWLYEHPGGTLSEALDWGLRQTAAAYPSTAEYYFTIYHVFGDPTVRLFGLPLNITHEPLVDTCQRAGHYGVDATLVSEAPLASVLLYWRSSPTAAFTAVPMTAGSGNAYRGDIPGQPYGTQVQYYLQAADGNGVSATHPENAPAAWHTFRVDVLFTHTPQSNTAVATGPYVIQAGIAAEGSLTVTLHWSANGGAYSLAPMSGGAGGLFSASIPGQPAGTTVSYYLTASTGSGYSAYEPPGAPETVHQFLVDAAAPVFAGLDLATAGDHTVALSWTAATEASGPVTYSIYRATNSGGQDFEVPLAATQGLTYSDTAVNNGTRYYYVVCAQDALGNAEGNRVERSALPRGLEVVSSWSMGSDPGWLRDSGWAFGTPRGLGAASHGYPDPTFGATGSFVMGYNLSGDYGNSMAARYLTTLSVDCSSVSGTQLRFRRWLNVEQPSYDHATIDVSRNGLDWVRVWENPAEVTDNAWTAQTLDVSAQADGCATFRVRWGMGPTDAADAYSGWNLDDVQIWGVPVTPVDTQAPSFAGLTSATGADSQVTLTWNSATDASLPITYEVYRAALPGGQVFSSPLVRTQALTYVDRSVTNGATYYYIVRAADAAGNRDGNLVEQAVMAGQFGRLREWSLATDPGWACGMPWAFGVPRGRGGRFSGFPDPTAGYTGTTVLGYNLRGDYGNRLMPRYLTSESLDCSRYSGTQLRYRRWLNVEMLPQDRAAVEISPDGSTWHTVWQNDETIQDAAWQLEILDISAYADGCATVRLRWVMGPTNKTLTMSGWNLDDIEIWGTAGTARGQTLAVAAPSAKTLSGTGRTAADTGGMWTLFFDGAFRAALEFGPAAAPRRLETRGADSGPGARLWPLADGSSRSGVSSDSEPVEGPLPDPGRKPGLRPASPQADGQSGELSSSGGDWALDVVPAADAEVLLSWAEPAGLPPEQLVVMVEIDAEGALVPGGLAADLRRETGLTVPAGAARRFLIRTAPQASFDLTLAAGWNLVSLPIAPALPAAAAVFGNVIAAAAEEQAVLTYDPASGGYVPAALIQALHGYWVYATAAGSLAITGVTLREPVLTLSAGWNLVGVPAEMAEPPGAEQDVGPWFEVSPATGTLQRAQDLKPGRAYWVFSPAPATLAVGVGP